MSATCGSDSVNIRYYLVLDEDFYAGLRAAAAKRNIDSDKTVAFQANLRAAAFGRTVREREAGLRTAERLRHVDRYFDFGFTALANAIRTSDTSEAIKSLADYYLWRKAGRPPLHGIRHGAPRPQY